MLGLDEYFDGGLQRNEGSWQKLYIKDRKDDAKIYSEEDREKQMWRQRGMQFWKWYLKWLEHYEEAISKYKSNT